MPWFKVDDKLHDHRKARRAKKAAMGVWVLAGSWCADHLTDGFVPASVLSRWGTRKDASTLVEAEFWDPDEQDGEKGWRFRNWDEFQPSKAEVEAERAATRDRVRAWRDRRRNAVTGDVTDEVRTDGVQAPRPDPSRPDPTVAKSGRHLTSAPGLSDDDLDRIAEKTNGDRDHARLVVSDILDRAGGDVDKPRAYVLRAIAAEPERYRQQLRITKDTECDIHAGQSARACAGCAADAKAVDR